MSNVKTIASAVETTVAALVGDNANIAGLRSAFTKGANSFLVSCGLNAARVVRVGKSKVTIQWTNTTADGKSHINKVDVPAYMLAPAFLKGIAKQVTDRGNAVGFRGLINTVVTSCGNLPRFKVEVAHLCRNETLRLETGLFSTEDLHWTGVASPELFGTRLYSVELKDSSFAAVQEGMVISPNAGTKLIARQHSIASNKPLFEIEGVKTVVVLDTDNKFLKEIFASGSLFVSRSFAVKAGPARIVSKVLGLKAVTSVMDDRFAKNFVGFDAVAHAGCVKAGVRGLFRAITGKTELEVMLASNEEVLSAVEAASKTIKTAYGELKVVPVVETLGVTNPYSLYGCEWNSGDVVNEIFEEEDGLYNHVIELFKNGEIDSIPQYVMEGVQAGTIRIKKDEVRVKTPELQNIVLTHGVEVARQFADKLNPSKALAAHFSSIGDSFTEEETVEIFEWAMWNWSGMVNPGSITPDNYKSQADYDQAISIIMNGVNLSTGRRFPGLATGKDVVLTLGGQKFVFPGCNNNEGQFMPKEEDDISSGVNLGPVAEEFLQLELSRRNQYTNWKVKVARFNASMSNVTFREEMNSFRVRGKYMAIMTPTWETKIHEVFTTRKGLNGRVTYKKDPCLFWNAITDVIAKDLPWGLFGEMSDVERFMFSTVAYVNPIMQQGQGNDADGDLIALMKTGGVLPVYEGQKIANKYWNAYMADEQDVNLLKKSLNIKTYPLTDLHDAMQTAKENKANVGLYTSELFVVQHALDAMLSNGLLSQYTAAVIKEVYALTMQDEAVRAIKHESGTSQFGEISLNGALRSEVDVSEFVAQTIVEIAEEKLGEVVSIEDAMKFVAFSLNGLRGSNVNAWASRSVGKTTKAFFSREANSFTTHSMFLRSTWIKAEDKLKAEGMTAYKRNSLWVDAEAVKYGWNFIGLWTNRVCAEQKLIKAFAVKAENSICEYVYIKVAKAFEGRVTSSIELAVEEVETQAEVTDLSDLSMF